MSQFPRRWTKPRQDAGYPRRGITLIRLMDGQQRQNGPPLPGTELDVATAARAFGEGYFNLLRRGADGSLKLSSDHWRLQQATPEAFRFSAREQDAPPLEVRLEDVERLVWDRLPRQQVRSQIRFVLVNGDVWTFSGTVDVSVLPDR